MGKHLLASILKSHGVEIFGKSGLCAYELVALENVCVLLRHLSRLLGII